MRVRTERLELRPLPAAAAATLPDDREAAARVLGARLASDWPQPDLLDVLPLQAAAAPDEERFGVWVIIEQATRLVIGDVGFLGPPAADGTVEIGYSVVESHRRLGYATEAAGALVASVLRQPGVRAVVAGCDKGNTASVRLLERLGFARTGEQEGQLRWRYQNRGGRHA